MSTSNQIAYYLALCDEAYVEPEDGYEDWSTSEMSKKIEELKELV